MATSAWRPCASAAARAWPWSSNASPDRPRAEHTARGSPKPVDPSPTTCTVRLVHDADKGVGVTLVLDDAAVRSVFDWKPAVQALRDAYAAADEPGRFPSRVLARGGPGVLRTLSGVPGDGALMGTKTIAGSLGERRMFSYLVALFDPATAELAALLDGNSITGFRTAATSALAADLLAPVGALDVAVIGSGFEARKHLEALASVRELASVRV